MSEVEAQPSLISASVDAPVVAVLPTAGSLLREARLAAGTLVETIAFSLKVPVVKIEALEVDDVSAFPDITFMRALASSMCRILHVDSAPVLALMPHNTAHSLGAQNVGARPTFRDTSTSGSSPKWLGTSSRWLLAAVVLLLLGAAGVAFTPQGWKLPGFSVAPSTQTEVVDVMPPDTADAETANPVQSSRFSMADAPTLAGASASGPQEAISASESPTPSTPPPRLSVSARGDTWVQVMNKSGKVLLERNLAKGDSVSVDDQGLLSVVIGSADVSDVRVGDKARDLTKNTRNNVARFEVQE